MFIGIANSVVARPRPLGGFLPSPALHLPFIGVTSLDPRITYTRASAGWDFGPTGLLEEAATNIPRLTYNPVTLAPEGLWIEEQRTNSIRNSTMVGAVAGSPGTAPSNWIAPAAFGTTVTIVGTGVQSGINYIDVRFQGTTSSAGAFVVYFESVTGVAAANGQIWTSSAYVALIAGSIANITNCRLAHNYRGVAGADSSTAAGTDFKSSLTAALQRFTFGATIADAATQSLLPLLQFVVSGAVAVDITIRIGLPQLELGASASSPILTSTTAVTRAVDVATTTGTNFSNWFNATEGTFVVEWIHTNPDSFPAVLSITDGTLNNRMNLVASPSTAVRFSVVAGGVAQAELVTSNYVLGTVSRAAFSYKANDFALSSNGAAVQTDVAGTVPVVDRSQLGFQTGGLNILNGHIRRISFYPVRLSNAQLQALST